ncbi:hypothetical protein PMIN01_00373 [Paraphaeosphaeria minitans]|uniref:Uncharacterized protein n=1 Tax=Paraphaeosphaeria minitans TaxID=565426 RepID=A0A9P6GSN6_9PLEO|nr:hypothetical protein PMIN01_00373 [Paraphaeosphaeria minitans]
MFSAETCSVDGALTTAANSQQPTTNSQQPATSNQQPATSNQQPATSNQPTCDAESVDQTTTQGDVHALFARPSARLHYAALCELPFPRLLFAPLQYGTPSPMLEQSTSQARPSHFCTSLRLHRATHEAWDETCAFRHVQARLSLPAWATDSIQAPIVASLSDRQHRQRPLLRRQPAFHSPGAWHRLTCITSKHSTAHRTAHRTIAQN